MLICKVELIWLNIVSVVTNQSFSIVKGCTGYRGVVVVYVYARQLNGSSMFLWLTLTLGLSEALTLAKVVLHHKVMRLKTIFHKKTKKHISTSICSLPHPNAVKIYNSTVRQNFLKSCKRVFKTVEHIFWKK